MGCSAAVGISAKRSVSKRSHVGGRVAPSSAMHPALAPAPRNTIQRRSASSLISANQHSSIRNETAHCSNYPTMLGIISQASGLDHPPTLSGMVLGNGSADLTGVLACATSYHTYHSSKVGNLFLIKQAIETGMFSHVRAFAFSSAKAFLNEYDIKSNGTILCAALPVF